MVEHTLVNVSDNEYYMLEEDTALWSSEKVKAWLNHNGYKELVDNLSNAHSQITGEILLTLSVNDLQQSPFNMTDLHEREHLHLCIETLRKAQFAKYMKKIDLNGLRNGFHNNTCQEVKEIKHTNGHTYSKAELGNMNEQHTTNASMPLIVGDEDSDVSVESRNGINPYPTEKLKTLFGLLYLMLGFVVSVVVLQFVHERVPSMTEDPPLPDLFFDAIPRRVEWAFSVCETAGIILVFFACLIAVFHRHRFIIARRVFFIMGTLYLYRSCTMLVTTLPVPGLHFRCASKTHYKLSLMLTRAVGLLYGGGLTVTGSHHLCGDYLFSGHTIVLVLTYLTITEYTCKRWWPLHWLCWFLSALGILCILLAHDHYTIDVVVAYLLTTRLFWTYHTMCYNGALKEHSNTNFLSRAWWFGIFTYFECNVSPNGAFPCLFEWPLPWPHRLSVAANQRRSIVKGI